MAKMFVLAAQSATTFMIFGVIVQSLVTLA